ncbi:alternative ribosome rescue aminoacyl-tRNA hydrolase ArfB [Stratiformator vulcanicus]|uniref:Peptidyl-tRNA hydrolase ArfB n=1 Tax=Stratiformator vulcanicus TaxID=2527980 RepID=A0A517QZL3_9PLAN|nr:alternative ribosome rescue aminoacyl-tRNA hydrolase ArfB [Stratiformator vulcanicus]QDT37071.1 Peptidyl-tRNA hydrolase ArfB [Stratiformator vulcanicus]
MSDAIESTVPNRPDKRLRVSPTVSIDRAEFTVTYVRSSGPGGQNVNKVATKACLRWSPLESPSLPERVRTRFRALFGSRLTNDGEIILMSQRYRDRTKNRDDCIERLRKMLLEAATQPKKRRPTRPSKGSKQRRLDAKKRRSETKRLRGRPDQ